MYFEEQNIRFFLCYMVMFIIMFLAGLKLEKNNKYIYPWFFAILVFGINEGLRYMRGVDYLLYMSEFDRFIDGSYPGVEYGWHFICNFVGEMLELPWPAMVLLLSFTLIISACLFLRNYRSVLSYALPLFAYYAIFAETLARWFFAYSFVLIAMYFLIRNHETKKSSNYVYAAIFLFIAFEMHYAILTVVIPMLMLYPLKKIFCSSTPAIILMCLAYLLFSPSVLGKYTGVLELINIGGRFDSYSNNISEWITENDQFRFSLTDVIIGLIFIIKGRRFALSDIKVTYLYNIALVGTILAPAMRMLELTTRINYCWTFFQFLIFAYIFDASKRTGRYEDKILSIMVVLLLFKNFVSNCFTSNPQDLLYLWDIGFNF